MRAFVSGRGMTNTQRNAVERIATDIAVVLYGEPMRPVSVDELASSSHVFEVLVRGEESGKKYNVVVESWEEEENG